MYACLSTGGPHAIGHTGPLRPIPTYSIGNPTLPSHGAPLPSPTPIPIGKREVGLQLKGLLVYFILIWDKTISPFRRAGTRTAQKQSSRWQTSGRRTWVQPWQGGSCPRSIPILLLNLSILMNLRVAKNTTIARMKPNVSSQMEMVTKLT